MPYDAHHGDLRRGGPSGGGTRQPQPLRAAPTGDAGCPPARSPRRGCGRPRPPARPPAAVTRCRARCSASGCAAGGGVKGDAPRSATGSAQLGSAEGSAAAARFPRPAWPYLLLLRLRACRRAEASRGLRVAARRAVAAVEVTWEGKGRAVRHGDTPDTPTAPRRPLRPAPCPPHMATEPSCCSTRSASTASRAPAAGANHSPPSSNSFRRRKPITVLLLPTVSGGESQSQSSFFLQLPAAGMPTPPCWVLALPGRADVMGRGGQVKALDAGGGYAGGRAASAAVPAGPGGALLAPHGHALGPRLRGGAGGRAALSVGQL